MDENLYQKISIWFETHKESMISDIMRLVRIASVSDQNTDCKPFGQGCRDALEEMLTIAGEHGFQTENHEYYVGSIGKEDKNWDNTIGFWNHLDVVPAGTNWDYKPFDPVLKEHFLIGRGAQDNKGPAIGIMYMMQCIQELKIPMKHELCLFVGCDEESGMEDLSYYTSHYRTPKLSMIADSGFPVCYGEKGIIEGQMISDAEVSGKILELYGGNASNMIPDFAVALLKRTPELEKELAVCGNTMEIALEDAAIRVTARGTSKHSAFPEGSKNAIHELCRKLSQLKSLETADSALFTALSYVSEEYYGEHIGIAYEDDISGRTTCAATILKLEGRKVSLEFNLRYAISAEAKGILSRLEEYAKGINFDWRTQRHSAPNYFPKEHPVVKLLTDTYNKLTGEQTQAFVMGGGTYARKLPNAFAYGIGGMRESKEDLDAKKKLFKNGRGGAHELDEALNIRLLLEAMKIYTMSIIAMNDCPL